MAYHFAPGHPFLKAVIESVLTNIDSYRPWLDGTGKIGVLRVSGPIAYTLAIHPLLGSHSHRKLRTNTELNLSYVTQSNSRTLSCSQLTIEI